MSYKKSLYLILALLPVILMLPVAFFTMDTSISKKLLALLLIVLVDLILGGYVVLSKIKLEFNQLIFMTITMAVVGSVGFMMQDFGYLYMPIIIGVMLIAMIIDVQLAIVLHIGLTVIVSLVVDQGTIFFAYYAVVGIVTGITVNFAKKRQHMLVVVACLGLFSGLYQGLLAYILNDLFDVIDLLRAMGNTALSIIIVIGSLPLWESIFKVMTPLKLLEFSNSDHKLMQRLLVDAPGTYHHVQMVGNLAERSAKAIGADGLLAKTGAIFHDVGKLKEPLFFIENQNGGPNPHDEIAAEDSAKIIIDHVAYGVKLGQEYRLPTIIIDIIRQHHGTSIVRFFYDKAQNYNDGVKYSREQFQYDGPKPQTKEAAIVMLSDCVEAFVRSLSEEARTLEKIQWIIDEIIRQKFEDGQLDECPLQISELKIIGGAFMEVYNGLYHERITYPGKVTK